MLDVNSSDIPFIGHSRRLPWVFYFHEFFLISDAWLCPSSVWHSKRVDTPRGIQCPEGGVVLIDLRIFKSRGDCLERRFPCGFVLCRIYSDLKSIWSDRDGLHPTPKTQDGLVANLVSTSIAVDNATVLFGIWYLGKISLIGPLVASAVLLL